MNVFCDYHHGDLYYSLHLIFEERLKANLFRPIGLEWFQKGFWKIAEPYGNASDTIDQYLGIPADTWDIKKEPTQKYGQTQLIDGVYHIPVKIAGEYYIQKAITFDTFLKMNFDFVIASHALHDYAYSELVRKHKPKAVYIRQIANIAETPRNTSNCLLAINTPMPRHINYIKYHPEHHRDYCYMSPTNHNVIKSFIANPHVEPDLPLFHEFERQMPDFTFKMHGILGRDGVISADLMPQSIKTSAWIWHVKQSGCGGFVARQALACGRPCIIKKRYAVQHHTLCNDLYQDSVNCIDLDLGNTQQNIEKLRIFSEPQRHMEMCKNTAEKFKRDVDFNKEAENIKAWINNLHGV